MKIEIMSIPTQLAKHLRDVHFGGNWTVSNLSETLADVTWEQATTEVDSFNTIATLLFHINYFVGVALKVLRGGPLEGNDKLSFDHPPINSQDDWEQMKERCWTEAREFADLIEQLPEDMLLSVFKDEKYGNYFRNLLGIIEHSHYHLGQIVIIKKLIGERS